MKNRFLGALFLSAVVGFALVFPVSGEAQKRRAQVCGDPTIACPGRQDVFQPYDLPFRLPRNPVIWESQPYYAIILKSINAKDNCDISISEDERLETQKLFPRNKVFADRCGEPGNVFYSNTNSDFRFMAVYAGKTLAEANRVLNAVRATGKYPTANIRRMFTGFNGT